MTLDDIPADKKLRMTKLFARLFRAAGCEPTCHCCEEPILVRDSFQLASVDGTDEMLCDSCTPDALIKKRQARQRRSRAWAKAYPGYSRPSKAQQ